MRCAPLRSATVDLSLTLQSKAIYMRRADRHARNSYLTVFVGRQILPRAVTKTTPFMAIQGIESKQGLAGLPPQGCFIPAKPVERIGGQIGQT